MAEHKTPTDPARRRTLGPAALKAYAHPLRMEILRYLKDHGAATATELAAALEESTGQTSYHLRQLARHGLVEDLPDRGRGRERWWRSVAVEIDSTTLEADPTTEPVHRVVLARMVKDRADALNRWVTRSDVPEPWRRSVHTEITVPLTVEELDALNEAVDAAVAPFAALAAQRRQDAGTPDRPRVRIYYDAFPLLTDDAGVAQTPSAPEGTAAPPAADG